MKLTILTSLLILLNGPQLYAQFTTSGSYTTTNSWVGIGTLAPQRTLQVIGTGIRINATGNTTSFFDMQDVGNNQVVITKTAATGLSTIDITPNSADGVSNATIRLFRSTLSTGIVAFQIHSGDGSSNINTLLGGNTGTSYINSLTGNLGIGTKDPRGYKLAVNGRMIASSVTVLDYANWPDYVFNKGYQLLPLTTVQNYINQNHHLPEMPSAVDVEKNGVNVGEIIRLQTKKIEELTLYLLEKEKQLKEQAAALQKQEARLRKLEILMNSK
jgi:hypothetical protein